jgi:16S rRNA processing protein RimM
VTAVTRPEWIEVGRVSRAHGVHGEVRVRPSSDNPDRFLPGSVLHCRPDRIGVAGPRLQEQVRLTVDSLRGGDGFPIVAFQGVPDRTAAEALRGHILEIPASELPELDEEEYYPFDLIGLVVRDQTGMGRGTVVDAVESPAHALLVIKVEGAGDRGGQPGGEILVPFVYEAVPVVELAEGYLVVADSYLE